MYHWRWSNGDAYYKSARVKNNNNNNDNNNNNNNKVNTIDTNNYFDENINMINEYSRQQKTIQTSLSECPLVYDDELINITNNMFSRNQNISSTKREDLDNKISDREMIAQRGFNPFSQNNYVNDVSASDRYLKPVSTTQKEFQSSTNFS
jgi:hypothetical protein